LLYAEMLTTEIIAIASVEFL